MAIFVGDNGPKVSVVEWNWSVAPSYGHGTEQGERHVHYKGEEAKDTMKE